MIQNTDTSAGTQFYFVKLFRYQHYIQHTTFFFPMLVEFVRIFHFCHLICKVIYHKHLLRIIYIISCLTNRNVLQSWNLPLLFPKSIYRFLIDFLLVISAIDSRYNVDGYKIFSVIKYYIKISGWSRLFFIQRFFFCVCGVCVCETQKKLLTTIITYIHFDEAHFKKILSK